MSKTAQKILGIVLAIVLGIGLFVVFSAILSSTFGLGIAILVTAGVFLISFVLVGLIILVIYLLI